MNPGYQPCYKPTKRGYLQRARTAYKIAHPEDHTCSVCGVKKMRYMEIHHINKDITDNDILNLQMVCKSCHMDIHA